MIRRISPVAVAVAAGCAMLFGLLIVPLATGRIFTFGDLAWFHLPMRRLYQHGLHSGGSFLWTPDLANGLYLHAEGQIGMAHPLHLVLYDLLPVWAAMNLEMLSSYVIAFVGMWLLLRRLSLGTAASLVGAMSFAFCGFNLMHLNHLNAVAVVAHIPWLLWGADMVATSASLQTVGAGFACVALALGSQILLGYPHYVWMTGVALAWFVVYRMWGSFHVSRLALVAGAMVCGGLIGAVQLLPTLEALPSSFRMATQPEFRVSMSLHPANLLQLWSPFVFANWAYSAVPEERVSPHELALYDGALATVALAWLALRWRLLQHRALAVAFALLGVAAYVLASGKYAGVYSLLSQLPGLSTFRAPARHIVLVHFALAGLTAIAIDDVLDVLRLKRPLGWAQLWPLAVPVTLGVATVVAASALSGSAWAASHGAQFSPPAYLWAGLGIVAVTALLLALAARGWHVAVPLVVLVAAIDFAAWGIRYTWLAPLATVDAISRMVPRPLTSRRGDYIFPRYNLPELDLYSLRGLRSSLAYVGLPLATVLDPADPIVQRIAGVKWTWATDRFTRVEDPMPRARLVTDVRVSGNAPADIHTIDIRSTALVDSAIELGVDGAPGEVEVVDDLPGRLVLRVDAPAPQFLIVTERFHRGWRADEDGRAVTARAVYGDFLGCVVSQGRHTVTFTFAPASFRYGLWITIAGLLGTAAMSMALVSLGRRGPPRT